MSGNAWSRRLGLVAATGVLLAGCGSSSAPSDAVPALGDSLDRVDDAIVDGRYDDARSELDELVGTTTSAREAGDLESSEAERILAAAAEVTAALPAEEPEEESEEPEPSEPAEPEPTSEPTPEATEDEPSEEEQKELEKEQEKLEKEAEKDADEGSENGNGESSDNGPDDGEGS